MESNSGHVLPNVSQNNEQSSIKHGLDSEREEQPNTPIFQESSTINSEHETPSLIDQESQLNKRKRQRRSYSCGPCKLLKIKCDLQIPCASCKKFKRVNRCLLQPPQPPSEEELNKIKERKKRSANKKLKVSNDIVHTFNDNQNSLASLVTSLSSTSKSLQLSNGNYNESSESYRSSHVRPNHTLNLQPEAVEKKPDHPINHISAIESHNPNNSQYIDDDKLSNNSHTNRIELLLNKDTQRIFELNMVDIKRIKRLLPNNFKIFEKFYNTYINSLNPILIDLQDHDEMFKQAKFIYNKLLNINDEDSIKNLSQIFKFNIIEMRHLSLMFLIMANGYLFDENETRPFLLDYNRMINKDELINDWIKISRFLKLKILTYENLTDLIYLIDFYLIIKNYFLYKNDIIDNYLEFNNLLNYIVLNNDFISLIEDPVVEPLEDYADNNNGNDINKNNDYPESAEFKILAKYWIQIRLIELEFTFFQVKGSLMVSNQLKNTVVPHKRLLSVLYGPNAKNVECELSKHSIKIWGLYYKKSGLSTSIKGIIKNYLDLYSNVSVLLSKELSQVENEFNKSNKSINHEDVELLLKNQNLLLLSIRWLSFIRIESNYFPSLRYASYFTTMINLFNHFNLLDEKMRQNENINGILDFIIDKFPLHFLKSFLQSLIYQALFLILMKFFLFKIDENNNNNEFNSNSNFKINLYKIYPIILNSFQTTLNKFLNNNKFQNLTFIPFFKSSQNILIEFNQVLNDQSTSLQSTTLLNLNYKNYLNNYEDLTDLLYKLKAIIPQENWEFLINLYFGSRDNFFRYVEKVWDLFQYLKIENDNGDKNTTINKEIFITPQIKFNDQFIEELIGKLSGFEFSNDVVSDYMKLNVEPNTDD
ncbi:uncharacterized protein KGF55_004748 [Candida pseudojiufengensis]|uniref:uncharacterized protein n=1 Tax=Candida pseudojiufengensis TaxID=497109 RepID=UPI002224FC11|nr:uncharacterized protein KGF55_004748 [Candida pseudojiufengensis]KAI5960455.1 hypothetical protein KGF55_004748 [Candida pseudojiufengensis]